MQTGNVIFSTSFSWILLTDGVSSHSSTKSLVVGIGAVPGHEIGLALSRLSWRAERQFTTVVEPFLLA
jgi:hypothetical protein